MGYIKKVIYIFFPNFNHEFYFPNQWICEFFMDKIVYLLFIWNQKIKIQFIYILIYN